MRPFSRVARLRGALLCLLLGGCFLNRTSLPPWPKVPTETIVPGAPGADWYMAPPPTRAPWDRDPVRQMVADEVGRAAVAAGLPPPPRDHRLDRLADDIARTTPEDRQPSLELVAFLLGHYGVVEPEPNLLFVRGGPRSERAITQLVRPQVAPILKQQPRSRIGVGVFRGEELVVVLAVQEQHIELRPVPRTLAPGLVAELDGRLLDGLRNPKVIITAPGGGIFEVSVQEGHGRFRAAMGCRRDQPGAYQVEIVGEAERGPAVLANFPVYCGEPAPRQSPPVPLETGAPQEPAVAERELLALVNREREGRGLGPVRLDRRLVDVARAHSKEMADTGVVAHISPRTGNAADRVKRAGMLPRLVAENVGRAYSATQAHRGFMGSPGHRANVVEPRVTAVGIGIAAGHPENGTVPLFVTQLFTEGL